MNGAGLLRGGDREPPPVSLPVSLVEANDTTQMILRSAIGILDEV